MRTIKRKILILAIGSLFLGCSQSATSVFKKDPIYAQHIQYTKILKVVSQNNVDAIFNITYLNSVEPSNWDNDKQNFLIGEYYSDENNKDYRLTMNNEDVLFSKDIDKNSKLYKNIALKNRWATYSIVTFNDIDDKTLTLTYTNPADKNSSISFIKE
jgi:hypothetical protein